MNPQMHWYWALVVGTVAILLAVRAIGLRTRQNINSFFLFAPNIVLFVSMTCAGQLFRFFWKSPNRDLELA